MMQQKKGYSLGCSGEKWNVGIDVATEMRRGKKKKIIAQTSLKYFFLRSPIRWMPFHKFLAFFFLLLFSVVDARKMEWYNLKR